MWTKYKYISTKEGFKAVEFKLRRGQAAFKLYDKSLVKNIKRYYNYQKKTAILISNVGKFVYDCISVPGIQFQLPFHSKISKKSIFDFNADSQ